MTHITLPRWVQWSGAIGFMALPLITCTIALVANVAYAWQYGPAWVAVGVLCSVGLIILPIVATITGSWTTRAMLFYTAAAVFNLLTALQLAADDRFAGMFTRSEAVAQYEGNKEEIARLLRDLAMISERSTPSALKAQVAALEGEIATQKSLIEVHSDPKQKGPCRTTCEGYKLKLSAQQVALGALAERLGHAEQRERLEVALQTTRSKREVAAPPKKAGLSVIVNNATAGLVTESQADITFLIIMTFLYMLVIEVGTYMSGPAAMTIMKVATSKPTVRVEATVEEPVAIEAYPPVLDAVFHWPVAAEEPVQATVIEQPVTVEAPVKEEKKPRKRRADGRFAKKPGPKPKLKLNDLPRPKAENIVELFPKGE